MTWTSVIDDPAGGDGGTVASRLRDDDDDDAEDHFEPSLFAELSPPLSTQWVDHHVYTTFLAANLLLLYLNLARLSSVPINDAHPSPVTGNDLDDRDNDDRCFFFCFCFYHYNSYWRRCYTCWYVRLLCAPVKPSP